jgi:signal-transduction protein with cAMP-binding, CBS, and nucleotidyltransferase domain
MVAGRIHRLLVTHRGHVVGIVTSLDLVRLLTDEPVAHDTAAASLAGPGEIRRGVRGLRPAV